MKKFVLIIAIATLLIGAKVDSIYDFQFNTIDGKATTVAQFKDKVLLIVNTASKCGYTKQYEGLESIYKKYHDRGFEIVGFPSNDYLFQEPGSNAEIAKFCKLNYGVSFTMAEKIKVSGKNRHPLYNYLTEKAPTTGRIKWNFEKFLVDREGKIVARFSPGTKPESEEVISKIESLLPKK